MTGVALLPRRPRMLVGKGMSACLASGSARPEGRKYEVCSRQEGRTILALELPRNEKPVGGGSGRRVYRTIYCPRRSTVRALRMNIPQGGAAGIASASPIRVMTAADHPIFRGGLASLIGAYRDLQLVAEATNGREAVERYRQHRPDV